MGESRDLHAECVDAWIARSSIADTSEAFVVAFDTAFGALWQRAHRTLGDVTLGAITARVLVDASSALPLLDSLTIASNGLRCQDLRERCEGVPRDVLVAALRGFLIEFLTVLGRLTAEVITPALHKELTHLVHDSSRRRRATTEAEARLRTSRKKP